MKLSWWFRWWRICLQCRSGFDPWVRRILWRMKWQLTPLFLPGKPHGQRSLEGYSPRGCKESDTTEWLTLSLSKCTINVMHLNHPETIPPTPQSVEKLSSTKSVPGAKKAVDHCSNWHSSTSLQTILDIPSQANNLANDMWYRRTQLSSASHRLKRDNR